MAKKLMESSISTAYKKKLTKRNLKAKKVRGTPPIDRDFLRQKVLFGRSNAHPNNVTRFERKMHQAGEKAFPD